MAYGDAHDEVNSISEGFSIEEWEDAYELLLKKCKNLKKKNKVLKKKITECVHDTSILDELESCKKILKEEKEGKECVYKSLDEMKFRVQKLDKENKAYLEESKTYYIENSQLKTDLEITGKKLTEVEEKLNKFVKGKETLDNLANLTSNVSKKGLRFEVKSSKNAQKSKNNLSKKSTIKFVKALAISTSNSSK